MKTVSIIGAGLVGSLLAIYLARRGYEVDVFESRSDCRVAGSDHGRSINLAMSCRGITGLSEAGILPIVEKLMVPMRARAIHGEKGGVTYQAFGRDHDEYINAIQRTDLNKVLLDEADKFPSIAWHFDTQLLQLDVSKKAAHFKRPDGSQFTHAYQRVIGADGANSAVRASLQQQGLVSTSRDFISHGYKEIAISNASSKHLAGEHLHLWPRESLLLLGNPNLDGSVTGSLFLPLKGENSLAFLDNEPRIKAFFEKTFPDIAPMMPDVAGDFLNHPTGYMSTVKCSPWHHDDQCLLIGDAAHGLIPFFGQGMNSGFEDCRILNDLLDLHHDDWSLVMPAFYLARKPNTDAVSEMSTDNQHEIQMGIRDQRFNFKKQLEQHLMQRYPDRYVSKHVLVMFTNTPYAIALAQGRLQSTLLERICNRTTKLSDVDWLRVDELMREYDKSLAHLTCTPHDQVDSAPAL
ncbi:MAG: FAD-dependent monooxygenase [Proteobacteria bacterium]|nr:FAD-dependent monooxygenase [Pseudomonadota bacterium]